MNNLRNIFFNYRKSYPIFKKICIRSLHNHPKLTATPIMSLHDVAPVIKVEGLEKGSPVTLVAEMYDDNGKRLMSNAHYVANEHGEVNTSVHPSIGGSYEGVFQTGLISTLKVADGSFAYGRLEKKKVETPIQIKILLLEGHETFGCLKSVVDSLVLERHFMGPGVKKIPLKSGRIRGTLYLPKGNKPYPGIIDMFGASGSFIETRAALNASRGIASLALAYFNYDDIPLEKIFDLDLEYFEEAVEFLVSQPCVIPDRCGVIGSCVGGFLAHYMTIYIDKVKALYGVNFPTQCGIKLSYKGNLIYRANNVEFTMDSLYQLGNGIYTPKEELIHSMATLDSSYAELMNNLEGKYFSYVHGEDDAYKMMIGTRKLINSLSEKQKNNVTLHTCPKAGHIIDAPYCRAVNASYSKFFNKNIDLPGMVHNWGGEPQSDVKMQEHVWESSYKFFNHHIRDKSLWYQSYLANQQDNEISACC